MIGRFFGFVADGLDGVARRLLPATDLQVAAAERGHLFVAALNDVEAEYDGLPEPAEAMTPDVPVGSADWFTQQSLSALDDARWCVRHHEVLQLCRHLHGDLTDSRNPKSSAASIPPGASDAGPVQERPHPAPGYPNPLPACEAGSEGSGVVSDIPQSATPERPIVMCPLGGKCPRECNRTPSGCVTIYGPIADHEEALRRNRVESERTEFDAGYLAAVEVLERLAAADRKLVAGLDDKDMAFQFLQEANSFEGTAVYLRGCLQSSKRNPTN